jgi:hypothetical protein
MRQVPQIGGAPVWPAGEVSSQPGEVASSAVAAGRVDGATSARRVGTESGWPGNRRAPRVRLGEGSVVPYLCPQLESACSRRRRRTRLFGRETALLPGFGANVALASGLVGGVACFHHAWLDRDGVLPSHRPGAASLGTRAGGAMPERATSSQVVGRRTSQFVIDPPDALDGGCLALQKAIGRPVDGHILAQVVAQLDEHRQQFRPVEVARRRFANARRSRRKPSDVAAMRVRSGSSRCPVISAPRTASA